MNKLSALVELSSNVKIYVPSTTDVNQQSDNSMQVETILSKLSSLFGGSTSYEALGCWLSNQQGLVKEHVTICQSYCSTEQLEQHIDTVVELAEWLKDNMSQEAVSIEVNNKLYFV